MPHPLLHRLPLAYRIALSFCGILLLALSALWVLASNSLQLSLQQQADQLGETLAEQSADAVRELVLSNDLLGLNVAITQLTNNGSISRITVLDVDGQVLARAGAGTTGTAGTSSYTAEISLQDAVAGTVLLELDQAVLSSSLSDIRYYFWGTLVFALLLAVAIAITLSASIVNALNDLSNALEDPDESSLKQPGNRQDEVGRLQAASKNLLEKYQESRSHQLSLNGMKNTGRAKDTPVSGKLMASLLVIKVVNVNTAIELLHPSTLSALLNEYHAYLKQAARLYGGHLQQFTGESVLVSFDNRTCGEEHSFNAVCCAQLFLLLMQKISRLHREKKSQALQFRMAIHSGETFFSKTGNGNGSSETLLGKTQETAYFLCKQSQPGQLLISETTYSQAGGDNKLLSADSIEITIPADNMSFTAYVLDPDMGSYSGLLLKQLEHILPENE